MKGISVGDRVYLYADGGIREEKPRFGEAVVTRVGRKYVYCKDEENRGLLPFFSEARFSRDEFLTEQYGDCFSTTDAYNRNIFMFTTEKERDEAVERNELFKTIKAFLNKRVISGVYFSPSSYSVEQARTIAEILGIGGEEKKGGTQASGAF